MLVSQKEMISIRKMTVAVPHQSREPVLGESLYRGVGIPREGQSIITIAGNTVALALIRVQIVVL